MKTKALHTFCIILIMLVSMHFSKAAFGANPDTIYQHIKIDLDYFYGKKTIRELKDKIHKAALNYEIKAYLTDSFTSLLTPEELLRRGETEEMTYFPVDEPTNFNIDTVILIDKEITSFSVSYKTCFNIERNNYTFELSGLSLNCCVLEYIKDLDFPLFFASKADLIKLLGSQQAKDLFVNCYLGMLKAFNYEKLELPDSFVSFNTDIGKYIGSVTLDEMNDRMYKVATKGFSGLGKCLTVYKSNDLLSVYTKSEALDRGFQYEKLQIPLDMENPEREYIDTLIKENFDIRNHSLFSLSYNWNYNPATFIATSKNSGFGLYVPIQNCEGKTNPGTLFWIKWKDAEAIYTPIELSVLKYAFYQALVNFQDNHIK